MLIHRFVHRIAKLFAYFVIFLSSACVNHNTVIEGTLPNDSYDKEIVYWVPMEAPNPKLVDSTYIQNNKFHLAVSAHNRNKVGIVRVRPSLRLALQDILVFTEPRTVQVKLDSISSATGTPLNDVLQKWKDIKQTCDTEVYALRKKLRTADNNDDPGIRKEIEDRFAAYRNSVYQIIVDNKDNEVGKFIFSLHKSSFTPEQIQELGIEG